MRIAVFSDIHGNPYALQAVLDAIAAEHGLDEFVAAGDICFEGSDPAGCVDLLRDAGALAVYGNTDEFIFAPRKTPPDKEHLQNWSSYQATAFWAANRLGSQRVEWLAELPFELRFAPTDYPEDDLLVVHANPKTVHHFIAPPLEEQIKLLGRVVQPDDQPLLVRFLEDEPANWIAFGHLHYSSIRFWGEKRLVNVSPCSIALYDGDLRARYTVFTWEGREWQIERRFVEYEYALEKDALLASDIPDKEGKVEDFWGN